MITTPEQMREAAVAALYKHAKGTTVIGGQNFRSMTLENAVSAICAIPIAPQPSYQDRVKPWLDACFGPEIASDKIERNHRFLEEALELVQSGGCSASEAHQLVDYVYGRPVGEMGQEIGGVMNTLAALCLANGFDMHKAGEIELARVWTKVEKIRAKQAAKPKHSPLPEHPADPLSDPRVVALVEAAKWIGVCAQTTGGVAGPDRALMDAIERLAVTLRAIGGEA